MKQFTFSTTLPVPPQTLWDWHTAPGAFERLTPPWERVHLKREGRIEAGARVELEVRPGPLRLPWTAEIVEADPGTGFVDRQVRGPFAAWTHQHRFVAEKDGRSRLEDSVAYRLPGGAIGSLLGGRFVRRKLERMFRYRHTVTRLDLERWWAPGKRHPPLTILVTGASGMIGRALVPLLRALGHGVRTLSRSPRGTAGFGWDPATGFLDEAALEGLDAVVHLAGENIAGGRWTAARRERILRSREEGTGLLATRLAALPAPPRVLVSASGVNYYTSGGPHDESGPPGEGFLAEVCRVWEGALAPAANAGVRTVRLRAGVVLSPAGGALAKMLPAFLAGAGGPIGGGRQRMSWIAIDDFCDVVVEALVNPALNGPVNAAAPVAPTQADFARTLGRVLRRPAFAPLPAFVVRALFGQMGEETLLADTAAFPRKLTEAGYSFRFPELEAALRHLLGR